MTTSAEINHSRITAPGQNRENNGVYSSIHMDIIFQNLIKDTCCHV